MGLSSSTLASADASKSSAENNYNPFNIPEITLNDPSEFNGIVAARGNPPMHYYKKSEFAAMQMNVKAAYADGVVRGSYQKQWMMIDQTKDCSGDLLNGVNNTAIGGLAFTYLKTQDVSILNTLKQWCENNAENEEVF